MRVLIAGIDGYLGWPLAQHLAARGHIVGGIDRFLRRAWVEEVGSISAVPIADWVEREKAFSEHFDNRLICGFGDMLDYAFLGTFVESFHPDAVIHLAEMPSAPYSMIDQAHSAFTQQNNVIGSLNLLWALHTHCPEAHLVKLGTMGEYGTPDVDIPEGFFDVEFRGRRDRLPFPRQAGSYYHWSKVHDSNNTMFACSTWGLRATDVMQGVVYGTYTGRTNDDWRMSTRLDFDTCFGTIINRFVCQVVLRHPLTVYGPGGQKRGFIPLGDSLACLTLALESPPKAGEYRVFNQFEDTYRISELAGIVCEEAHALGIDSEIIHYENPRVERADHYYNPDHKHLFDLGYQPSGDIRKVISQMIEDVLPFTNRLAPYRNNLVPEIRWDTEHRRSTPLSSAST
ncbi:MAG: NAD-dependent epimerase/dehydratase family protein [Chloroflexi bacterium]|nr:NAD-dependent epimerase/dehydratase family protein [Chloroflexota bacterium]